MITFEQQKKLVALFENWASEHQAGNQPSNMIAFLHWYKLLNEDKVKEFLGETK